MTEPLSVALKNATAEAHAEAESANFISDLMEGKINRDAFVALAVQQLPIYQALENVLDNHYRNHPLVAPVHDVRLHRVPSLRRDLAQLVGDDIAAQPVHPATQEYVRVLTQEHSPELVLANHYVRYLGDLSGGQIIARLVQRHYGISPEALTFYQFPGIDKLKVYKDAYRAKLDALTPTPQERTEIIAQAVRSFALNAAVFADLAAAGFVADGQLGAA